VLVGHALQNDLGVLQLSLPVQWIRDTSQYLPFMMQWKDGNFRPRRLRDLVWDRLGKVIQAGEHCSIEDARAAMLLYKSVKDEWDAAFMPPLHFAAVQGSYYVPPPHTYKRHGMSWSGKY
jgi:RNA exonuclease 4